jgi:hypothetical protein
MLETLEDRTVPAAIVPGFNGNTFPANDDGSTGLVGLGFSGNINYFGTSTNSLYINNNGNVTFDSPLSTFTPFPINTTTRKILAPFFADVDTRGAGNTPVTYGTGTFNGRAAFGVNWINVGYFSQQVNKLNKFQLIIEERFDTGAGNFDFYFNYDQIQWETGDASGGSNGLGGSSARVGFAGGSSTPGTFFEFSGSAVNGAFLDSGPAGTSLIQNSNTNPALLGRYCFAVRGGLVNVPPVLVSQGGPYTINEGDTLNLAATVSDFNVGQNVTVSWDVNGDGTYDTSTTVAATGSNQVVTGSMTWAQLQALTPAVNDGPSNWNVGVRVADDIAGPAPGMTTLTVNNVAPTITGFTATSGTQGSTGVACNGITFQITLNDPSNADMASNFTYDIDWNGNGFTGGPDDQTVVSSQPLTIMHTYTAPGTYTPQVRATDKDGGTSGWFNGPTLTIVEVGIIGGNLIVAGTGGNDNISVNTANTSAVLVVRNSPSYNYGPFNLSAPGARVIVYGCDGIDTLTVNGGLAAEVFGGNGNDFIQTGTGNDQVWGENGDDYINLGSGDDVGIGGNGKDQITGGNGNDVLVGGFVDPQAFSWAMLQQVTTDWNTWDQVANPPPAGIPATLTALHAATTDLADAASKDTFYGNTGKDLFIYRATGAVVDLISGYNAAEKDYLYALP